MQYHDRTAIRKFEYFLYGNIFCEKATNMIIYQPLSTDLGNKS